MTEPYNDPTDQNKEETVNTPPETPSQSMYGQLPPPIYNQVPPNADGPEEENKMANTAFILSIVSLAGLLLCFPAVIIGGIALVLALLSRSGYEAMHKKAKTAAIISSISIVLGILFSVAAIFVYILFAETATSTRYYYNDGHYYDDYYDGYYDDSYDDYYDDYYDGYYDDGYYDNFWDYFGDDYFNDYFDDYWDDFYPMPYPDVPEENEII